MKIRSITYFVNPLFPLDIEVLENAHAFASAAKNAFEDEGWTVQTVRMATSPFPRILEGRIIDAVAFAMELEEKAAHYGFDFISIGPALIDHLESYTVIPEIIANTTNIFMSAEMAAYQRQISLPAIRACANVIEKIAPIDPNGFGNLRLTTLANVPPGSPFFPASYHQGGAPVFAIATQAADLAIEAFN
ncbi:MAG: DUF711 family protein, partial [Anaerolineales bacterium]|nr:DUF711 family protein [Anaerolineales bacterium]